MEKVVDLSQYKQEYGQAYMEEEQQQAPRKKVHRGKILLFMMILCVLVVCLLRSSLFSIQYITVEGNTFVESTKIIQLSELEIGENLFAINRKESMEKIALYPFIENVTIDRKIPNNVVIHVMERPPVGVIVTPNGYVQVSADGRMLAVQATLDWYHLPVLTGIELTELPSLGEYIQNDNLKNALKIISSCDEMLLSDIAELNLSQTYYILAYTNIGVEIRLGGVENVENKMQELEDILRELNTQNILEADIEYIDLRYDNAPVIKLK